MQLSLSQPLLCRSRRSLTPQIWDLSDENQKLSGLVDLQKVALDEKRQEMLRQGMRIDSANHEVRISLCPRHATHATHATHAIHATHNRLRSRVG